MTIGSVGNSAYDAYRVYNGTQNVTANETGNVQGTGDNVKKAGYRSSPAECQTCKNRKYQDGSNATVSLKSAAHVSPDAAGAAVRAHEGEHVSNAYTKAYEKGGKVVSANVTIHTSICPECGRTYVSGGVTNTQIKYPNESYPYQKERKTQDAIKYTGMNLDVAV